MREAALSYGAEAVELKDINAKRREVTHLISTPTVDRAGDIVVADGIDFANYKRNPVVLVDHDYRVEKIIGGGDPYVDGGKVYAKTTFSDKGLGAEAFELVKAKIARAWSIGFRASASEPIRDGDGNFLGYRFARSELLEYSLVAIPMNPDAVNNAIQCGVSPEAIKVLFRAPIPAAAAPGGANGRRRRNWQSAAEWAERSARAAGIARISEGLK